MITVKQELRLVTANDCTMKFTLTDGKEGMSVSEFADTCGTDFVLGGFKDVLQKFREVERKRSVPGAIVGSTVAATGVGLCCAGKYPCGVAVMTAGALGVLSSVLRRHAMMFRDCRGNEVDLFLGIVYVAGTKKQRYLSFSSFQGGDGSGY